MTTLRNIALISTILLHSFAFSQEASISEGKQVFITYPFDMPQPYLNFNFESDAHLKLSRMYPYYRFDGYTDKSIQKEWKVIKMENPYLLVLITPEIGGKIWTVIEKSTGKDIAYNNKVVKFRDIAMRGAWSSGGIEFNFGTVGHTPSTSTPVDYMIRKNEDGSVSCFLNDLDLPSRTEWCVEIRLPKDKAYLETRSFWYNPTPLKTSLYNWSCAAAGVKGNLRMYYPGNYYLGHDGSVHQWNIDEQGNDISYYDKNNFGSYKSYHVNGAFADHFGGYWEDQNVGFVHYSPYNDKPGKKIWLWGLSRQGMIWYNLLTDTTGNEQYMEWQSGILYNQPAVPSIRSPFKGAFLDAMSEVQFTEWWFPIKNIGGLSKANENGSLNVIKRGQYLVFGFCPTLSVNDKIIVSDRKQTIYSKNVNLKPLDSFIDSIDIQDGSEFEIKVGENILVFNSKDEKEKILNRPTDSQNHFDWQTTHGLYCDAIEHAKLRDYAKAYDLYRKCLNKDSLYTPALIGLAELYMLRIEWDSALTYTKRALTYDAYNAEANFLYGSIKKQSQKWYDALDGFGRASMSMSHRSAAYEQMSEIYLAKEDSPQAISYANKALDYDRNSINAMKILAIAYRISENFRAAKESLEQISSIDPLNHFVRFEKYLIDPSAENLNNFKNLIRCEFPHEKFLEMAIMYFNLNLKNDAVKLLEQSPAHPEVNYWLAYFTNNVEYLSKAITASPYLVYPSRAESEEVLKWAETKQPHWKTKYYLGSIYWSRYRLNDAKKYYGECKDQPDYAPFYESRAFLYATCNDAEAENNYLKALSMDTKDWRYVNNLYNYYSALHNYIKASQHISKYFKKFPAQYVIQFDMTKSLIYEGKYSEAIDLLGKTNILPYEGATETHTVYKHANLLLALKKAELKKYQEAITQVNKAKLWPENLGAGRPYDVDESLENYIIAKCLQLSGEEVKASEMFKQIAASPDDGSAFIHALALKETGKKDDAIEYFIHHDKKANTLLSELALNVLKGNVQSNKNLLDQTFLNGDWQVYYKIISQFY